MPVRMGWPRYEGGLADVMHNPRFATCTGLLMAGLEHAGAMHRSCPATI